MFWKVLVSLFSIIIFIKNISYAHYEAATNKNISGCVSIVFINIVTVVLINSVLFFFS